MDAATALSSGIPPAYLHQLPNGTFVHAGMFIAFGPDANCTLELCPIEWTVYQYRPSLPANVAFLVLFGLAMLVHIYLGIRWRTWGFMVFMICGCVWAMVGYGGRILLYINPWSFTGFMMQMVCITGAPVYFTAAIYVTLSRAIHFFAPEMSRLPPRIFYWSFISADILCLVLQAIGGAMSSQSSGSSQTGINIAMAGLILQVIVIAIFCLLFVDYMVRYIRLKRSQVGKARSAIRQRQQLFFAGLASAIVLILTRCAYRIDELSEGYRDSDKITNQSLFIGLESVMIFAAVLCLMVGHPGLGFQETNREITAEEVAVTESK